MSGAALGRSPSPTAVAHLKRLRSRVKPPGSPRFLPGASPALPWLSPSRAASPAADRSGAGLQGARAKRGGTGGAAFLGCPAVLIWGGGSPFPPPSCAHLRGCSSPSPWGQRGGFGVALMRYRKFSLLTVCVCVCRLLHSGGPSRRAPLTAVLAVGVACEGDQVPLCYYHT